MRKTNKKRRNSKCVRELLGTFFTSSVTIDSKEYDKEIYSNWMQLLVQLGLKLASCFPDCYHFPLPFFFPFSLHRHLNAKLRYIISLFFAIQILNLNCSKYLKSHPNSCLLMHSFKLHLGKFSLFRWILSHYEHKIYVHGVIWIFELDLKIKNIDFILIVLKIRILKIK